MINKENWKENYTHISNEVIDNEKVLRVVKSGKINEYDENTYAKLVDSSFHNGIIEVKMLSRLLKDAPQELLEKQIVTLCCVLNPEAIGICSDVLKDIQISLPTIPLKHQPQIIKINQLYTLIKEGLFQIGKNQMIGGMNNE